MSYNIFGEYTINEHMSNTDSTDCVDNPYFSMSTICKYIL